MVLNKRTTRKLLKLYKLSATIDPCKSCPDGRSYCQTGFCPLIKAYQNHLDGILLLDLPKSGWDCLLDTLQRSMALSHLRCNKDRLFYLEMSVDKVLINRLTQWANGEPGNNPI